MIEIKRLKMMGDNLSLLRDLDIYKFILKNNTSGTEIELTEREANAFYYPGGERELLDILNDNHIKDEHKFANRFKKENDNLLYAYTDTTTLRNALLVLKDNTPYPECILDLSVISFLCTMYDRIVVNVPKTEIPEPLRDCFVSLEIDPVEGLFGKRSDSRYYISPEENNLLESEIVKIGDNWSKFLGIEVNIKYKHIKESTRSPSIDEYLPGLNIPLWYDPIFCIKENALRIDEIASVQTWRYFINEKIAELLGCTYICTSLRYPVEYYSLMKKIKYHDLADDLFRSITDTPILTPNIMESPRLPPISLPNPFSVIMDRTKSKTGIWEEIAKLRDSFEVIRKAIRKAKKQGKCDERIIKEMTGSLQIAGKIPAKIDGSIEVVSTLVGSIPYTVNSPYDTALKIASTLRPAEMATTAIRKLLHPEMRFIQNFSNHAKGLQCTIHDIDRLWENKIDRNWIDTMVAIGTKNGLNATELRWRG